jgi:secreted trypsin-like serine protease
MNYSNPYNLSQIFKDIQMNKPAKIQILLMIVLCLAFTSCGGSDADSEEEALIAESCSVINLPSKSFKVINGQTCDNIEQAPITRITTFVDEGGTRTITPNCTGSFLNSNTVLTAAHCFIFTPEVIAEKRYGVLIGREPNLRFIAGSDLRVHPNIVGDENGRIKNDVAILKLSENVSNAILPISLGSIASQNTRGYVYGYGQTEEGDDVGATFADLRAGTMVVESVENDFINVRYDGDGSNVCFGDSGGPLVINNGATPKVVGVVSSGTVAGCEDGDFTSYTNLENPKIREWVISNSD